jgi:hypothetical protein
MSHACARRPTNSATNHAANAVRRRDRSERLQPQTFRATSELLAGPASLPDTPRLGVVLAEWLLRLAADHDGVALIVANTVGALMFEDGRNMWFKLRGISDLTGVSPNPPPGPVWPVIPTIWWYPNKLTRAGRSSSTRVVVTTNTGHTEMIRGDRFG